MKEKVSTRNIRNITAGLVLFLLLSSGCASLPVQSGHYTSGRILLLPPRDLVQNGIPHPKGAGSGDFFQRYLKQGFRNSQFEVILTDNPVFSATQIADKKDALEEAKRLHADYCLQVVLGEFLNAAPMTFRPDRASVEKAIMYDARTEDIVWELVAPISQQKGNFGNHLGLLKIHARTIANSIVRNKK